MQAAQDALGLGPDVAQAAGHDHIGTIYFARVPLDFKAFHPTATSKEMEL